MEYTYICTKIRLSLDKRYTFVILSSQKSLFSIFPINSHYTLLYYKGLNIRSLPLKKLLPALRYTYQYVCKNAKR